MKITLKDKIAIRKGYDSWEDMYDWYCRPGERPEVVAQLIEAVTLEYFKQLVIECDEQLTDDILPTSDRQELAFHDGIRRMSNKIQERL